MSVMWLGSRGPGGGEEQRKNTQTVDVATVCVSDCVWLWICQRCQAGASKLLAHFVVLDNQEAPVGLIY